MSFLLPLLLTGVAEVRESSPVLLLTATVWRGCGALAYSDQSHFSTFC